MLNSISIIVEKFGLPISLVIITAFTLYKYFDIKIKNNQDVFNNIILQNKELFNYVVQQVQDIKNIDKLCGVIFKKLLKAYKSEIYYTFAVKVDNNDLVNRKEIIITETEDIVNNIIDDFKQDLHELNKTININEEVSLLITLIQQTFAGIEQEYDPITLKRTIKAHIDSIARQIYQKGDVLK